MPFQHEESKNTLDGYIHKFKDEWYVVSNTTTYYKCDQLEGVKKCIQDIYL